MSVVVRVGSILGLKSILGLFFVVYVLNKGNTGHCGTTFLVSVAVRWSILGLESILGHFGVVHVLKEKEKNVRCKKKTCAVGLCSSSSVGAPLRLL